MKKLLLIAAISFLFTNVVKSQGCIAIRNLEGFGQFAQLGYGQSKDKWMLDINNRYFEAWRLIQGRKDISPKNASDNIYSYSYTMNIGLSRVFSNSRVVIKILIYFV